MKEAYTYSLIRRQPFILSRRNAYATVDNVSIEQHNYLKEYQTWIALFPQIFKRALITKPNP
ncbi:hypothetical protein D5E76_11380 [Vibrio parahaemolyticus]|nr:hypothetical protein D5E76_11380 [Vibrio parahaemolyticus]